ncbi:Protein UPSTREAM OF FLC like [Actinidia chinensis var. chinensis]|uniref:Protein UPSTREAM OF FLC like n=1 Tax=Actinidia chinensis var. chinensis TaxID=1590841 RepID=A0A2R6RX06_ACTCC|nr:Protein UPSTREAM OF FLC like [Actinidia chinensis var. chinensis]
MNSRASTEHLIPQKWRERRETSPERTKISTENKFRSEKKVSVVYYIHRNGLLEHPHFMEVPLSSSQGLYLTGNINLYIHSYTYTKKRLN